LIPGVQLVAVEGLHGELLPLTAPLPLGRRPASQWLHALEGALSYSLACRLTECLVTFPEELMGTTNMGKEGGVYAATCPSTYIHLYVYLHMTLTFHLRVA